MTGVSAGRAARKPGEDCNLLRIILINASICPAIRQQVANETASTRSRNRYVPIPINHGASQAKKKREGCCPPSTPYTTEKAASTMTAAPISGVRKIQQDKKAMAHQSAEGLKRGERLFLLACSSEQKKGRVPQPSPRSHNGCSTHEQPQALFCIHMNIVVADGTNVYPNKRFQTQRTRTKRSQRKPVVRREVKSSQS